MIAEKIVRVGRYAFVKSGGCKFFRVGRYAFAKRGSLFGRVGRYAFGLELHTVIPTLLIKWGLQTNKTSNHGG